MKHLSFISQFAKRRRELGAITQSSRALARRMAREARVYVAMQSSKW